MKRFGKIAVVCTLLFPLNCLWFRERPTSPPAGTHKELYTWVNDDFAVSAGGYKAYPLECLENDTVRGDIMLTEGEYITCYCIIDDENFEKWKSNDPCQFLFCTNYTTGGQFYIWLPYSATFHFAVVNHLSQAIWVNAEVILERWEK